jgi:hypothetical protein
MEEGKGCDGGGGKGVMEEGEGCDGGGRKGVMEEGRIPSRRGKGGEEKVW